ncbi:winged helix-turn-helix transcriptional regulator [Prevotella melaninogenica]|uniref:winged helix-turn-helix transcriptional regulator n=1 Tax=Prevotella melaninogenica TaxID=28132 RepID=UPI00242AF275|nr:winged helix-turn-helix transcriptional regulator [Prevotella melaninogenica]
MKAFIVRINYVLSGVNMLINKLKFLCEKGLIAKKQYSEVPPRVEYSLTPLGKKVLHIIDKIARFGMKNLCIIF